MLPLIQVEIEGIWLDLETHPKLFSPRKPDPGTMALLSFIEFSDDDRTLDLGCGYGIVGLYAAKVTTGSNVVLSDNDSLAIEYARRNAKFNDIEGLTFCISDAFEDIDDFRFTKIVCNPDYHSDFSLPKVFIHKGFNRLITGGAMWFVTKREKWYRNKLRTIFGNVDVATKNGYYIFKAIKTSNSYANSVRS